MIHELKVRNWKLEISSLFVYLLFCPGVLLYHGLERFKFIYLVPFLFIFLYHWQFNFRLNLDVKVVRALLLYIGLVVLSSLNAVLAGHALSGSLWVRDLLIITSPLIVFSHQMTFTYRHGVVLFLVWLAAFFTWTGFSNHQIGFDLILGRSEGAEMDQAAFLGFFFFFFLLRRKYLWVIATLIFILASGKRVIFLGLFPAFISYVVLFKLLNVSQESRFAKLYLISYYLVFFFAALYLTEIGEYFLELIGMGDYDLWGFLMGRDDVIYTLRPQILRSSLNDFLVGHGPGQADFYLSEHHSLVWSRIGEPTNPHNDFLKIAYDYGFGGVVGFYFILLRLLVRNKVGYCMFLYAIPVFIVDNSLIFIWHFLTALILIYQPNEDENERNVLNSRNGLSTI